MVLMAERGSETESHGRRTESDPGKKIDPLNYQEFSSRVSQHRQHSMAVLNNGTGQQNADRDYSLSKHGHENHVRA